jgi:hypothetical protein
MANDFSSDPDCVALWKFDNNAQDSKGGNDLTEVNSPSYDGTDKKEGTHCVDLESSSSQYGTIADGDLDAGFPGKGGTSEQSFSICAWIKLESDTTGGIVEKLSTTNAKSYGLFYNSGDDKIYVYIGYNGGASHSTHAFATALSTGIWYHVGVSYDSSDNGVVIRIWDDNAGALLGSNYEGTAGGDMSPDVSPLQIGRFYTASYFDGRIDEVVIFKKALSDDEIDQIRAGTYSSATEKSSAETGSGADAVVSLETQQDKNSADTGAGVDAVDSLQTPEAKTSSDAGAGAEGAPVQSAVLVGSESGSALEAIIARLLTNDESGGAVEAAEVEDEGQLKDLFATELAEGADCLGAKIEMPTKGGGMKLWT